jgi:hypothetical protein
MTGKNKFANIQVILTLNTGFAVDGSIGPSVNPLSASVPHATKLPFLHK